MRTLQPCGTEAAYRRHLHRHEVPCGPCRTAATQQSRLWARRRTSRIDTLFTELLDLISAECQKAGMLP